MAFDGSLLTRPASAGRAEADRRRARPLVHRRLRVAGRAGALPERRRSGRHRDALVPPRAAGDRDATLSGPNGVTVPLGTGRSAGRASTRSRRDGTLAGACSRRARGRTPSPRPMIARSRRPRSGRSRSTRRCGSLTVGRERPRRDGALPPHAPSRLVVRDRASERRRGGDACGSRARRRAAQRVVERKHRPQARPERALLVRVDATSTVGTSSLVAAFSLK